MIAHRVEGIVIAPVSDASRSQLKRLARFGVPFVLIDRTIPGVERDVVLGDSTAGARSLVEHLIALGHRRIGMIVEDENVSTARERRTGYVEALVHAGIELDPALVVQAAADPDGGVAGMEKLLQLDERPTGVFTVNNLVALGAIEAVRAAGPRGARRRCPRLLRRHRVRVAALPVPDRDAATSRDVRHARDAAALRADRRPPARPHEEGRPAGRLRRAQSCGARDGVRRHRDRRIEVGVRDRRDRLRARRGRRGGDDPHDRARGDDRAGGGVLREARSGSSGRDQSSDRSTSTRLPDLWPYHHHAQARLGPRRRRRHAARPWTCPSGSTPTSTPPPWANSPWGRRRDSTP